MFERWYVLSATLREDLDERMKELADTQSENEDLKNQLQGN